jgi:hypothetical protein
MINNTNLFLLNIGEVNQACIAKCFVIATLGYGNVELKFAPFSTRDLLPPYRRICSRKSRPWMAPLQRIRLPPSFGMGDVINLRTKRKQAKRLQAEQKAAANRLTFGRSKADRNRAQAQNDKAQRTLDQHRIETGDGQ